MEIIRTTTPEFYFNRNVVTENHGKQKCKRHYHDLFEIYFIESGSCCYFIDNKTYQLKAGDVILVPAGVVHNTEYKNSIHSRRLINCADEFIPESVKELLCREVCHFRNPELVPFVREIFQGIEWECNNVDAYNAASFKAYTHRLLVLIARNLEANRVASVEKHYIEDAIKYMQVHFDTHLTLPDMAKMYFVSPEHFSRVFKKKTGFHFSEYLNLLRLKKAESLLRQLNAATITEIAAQCGFNDSNYFSVQFKRIYGMSPKQYQSRQGNVEKWTSYTI